MPKLVLTCWGGVGVVTGANFLLEVGAKKILIDCGLLQGVLGADEVNKEKFDYDVSTIDFLFVTHAHIDHVGKIPKLVKDGFKGVIYSTPATKEIATLMLADTAKITEEDARETNTEALYTSIDADKAVTLWQTLNYHEVKDFSGFKLELFDAGHVLGSTMYQFTFPSGPADSGVNKKMMFTGDLGNSPSPLLRDTDKISDLTYLLMESVYGDRNHETTEERDAKFKNIVLDIIKRNATLVVPVFSLERTQVILYELNELKVSVPVFLDSPLAIHVTDIYERTKDLYNQSVEKEIKSGDDVFKFPKLLETVRGRDSREIENTKGAKIILAGSGMSTAGRIQNHEEKYLPDPNAVILFVGYQAPDTLGRQISEGAKSVVIAGNKVEVKARVEIIDGFSAHKDSNHLVEFVSETKDTLKNVFVTMGEPKSSIFLAQRLHDELGVSAIVPERGKRYELDI
jgi:metallo-beta-lactamase family protein